MNGAATDLLGFDQLAASRWITDVVDAEVPLTFARIGAGRSNLTYDVRDKTGRRWVLRRPPLGHLLASAHDVKREHHVLSRLNCSAVPAPAALGLCEDASVGDVPLLLMEHLDGVVVDEALSAVMDPATRRAVGMALPGALASIHEIDLEARGLVDFASHRSYAARQLKRWGRQWQSSRTRDLPVVDELARRLEAATPDQHEVTLVHGDFHMLNLIFERDAPRVRGVLDWELCTLGDPLADVGGLLAYWSHPGERIGSDAFGVSAYAGFPTRSELVAEYARVSGRDVQAVGFWETLACWKVAIIAEGVLRRRLDEPANLAEGEAAFDAGIVDRMLDRAVATAERIGI